jgi:hypothetical protein
MEALKQKTQQERKQKPSKINQNPGLKSKLGKQYPRKQ